MVTSYQKELVSLRAEVARLEAEVARELSAELASLPARFGFPDTAAFVAAVAAASGVGTGRRGRPAVRRAGVERPARRKRARITAETRAAVKKSVQAGRPGAAIAEELGISIGSVHIIKKALGLVKSRK